MATAVEFHTGLADALGFTCRLLRKAYRKGARVIVTGRDATLQALDRTLWTFEERDFVPHVMIDGQMRAERRVALEARTPIWLWRGGELPAGHPRVLVNLGGDALALADNFERVIELVSADPEDAASGRRRWRAWLAAGFQVTHHNAAGDRE